MVITEFDETQSHNPASVYEGSLPTQENAGLETSKKLVEPNKRLIALLIDLIVCYLTSILISVLISIVPLLPNLLPQPIILALLFMSRDYLFGGRGIGKNLMGLQVVSAGSGLPISLIQSWLRNLTLTAPLLVLELAGMLPGALLPGFIRDILNILETIYALIVLPLESYRAYSREDSLRLGDKLAGTKIVQSQTNFDRLLPNQKN